MKQRASLLLILLLLSLLAACGSNTTSTPTRPTPVSTPSSQATASPLVGNYATTITKADAPPELSGNVGPWIITFANNGRYAVYHEAFPISEATYQVKQNQLTIIHDTRCIEIGQSEDIPDAGTATYTWMLEGKMLTLKAVYDTCPDRKLVLSTHPWVKHG
jgi:hypothetical protein